MEKQIKELAQQKNCDISELLEDCEVFDIKQLYSLYNDWLEEANKPIEIDPVTLRMEFSDWLEQELKEDSYCTFDCGDSFYLCREVEEVIEKNEAKQ